MTGGAVALPILSSDETGLTPGGSRRACPDTVSMAARRAASMAPGGAADVRRASVGRSVAGTPALLVAGGALAGLSVGRTVPETVPAVAAVAAPTSAGSAYGASTAGS